MLGDLTRNNFCAHEYVDNYGVTRIFGLSSCGSALELVWLLGSSITCTHYELIDLSLVAENLRSSTLTDLFAFFRQICNSFLSFLIFVFR